MAEYRVSGAVFETNKNGPQFTGFIEIDGVKTNIALWPKRSAKGQDYLQVAENKMPPKQGASAPAPRSPFKPKTAPAPQQHPDLDDDIPFAPEFR